MTNNIKWFVIAALVLSVAAFGVAITTFSRLEKISEGVQELKDSLNALGSSGSSRTARSGTGTDFTEVGFDQTRRGEFYLTSSSSKDGLVSRMGFTPTHEDVIVDLADITLVTRGNATSALEVG